MAISSYNNKFKVQRKDDKKKFVLVSFSLSFFAYLRIRFRQIYFFFYALVSVIVGMLEDMKSWAVRRMFWGRSSLYRSAFHTIVSVITVVAVVSGLSQRLNVTSASEYAGLDLTSGIIGNQDKFSQLGTAESIGALGVDEKDYPEYIHKVEKNQTLSDIAEIYQINVNTVKWANSLKSNTLKVGQILRIPGIDGAIITVKSGDTLQGIATKYKGNVADILDLNSDILDISNPVLKSGMEIFIPNGTIPDPPKVVIRSNPVVRSTYPSTPGIDVPSGTFVHPLLDPGCAGWTWSRGFTPWHGGADLAKRGGCWINSVAAGTVTKAGWGNYGEGYHVVVEHANGFKTMNYHGDGKFAVKTGDYVKAGQRLFYMGSTGRSTGTHLHFELRLNNIKVNPEKYIKLR